MLTSEVFKKHRKSVLDKMIDNSILISVSRKGEEHEVNSKYDVSEIIESDLIDVEINYLVNCESTDISSENKVKDSEEYRTSWNIVFRNNKNKKMRVFIDCETGEVVEEYKKI